MFAKFKIGTPVRVSKGSGLDSGRKGVIIGIKPHNEFPISNKDWYQVRLAEGNWKGLITNVPKSRLEPCEHDCEHEVTFLKNGKEYCSGCKSFI